MCAPRSTTANRQGLFAFSTAAIPFGITGMFLFLAAIGAIEVRVSGTWAAVLSGATGVLGLGLLTASVVLGELVAVPGICRASHRPLLRRAHQLAASLMSILVASHVWTAVSISFFNLKPWDTVVPWPVNGGGMSFASYGASAIDLLIIVVVTSVVNAAARRLAYFRSTRPRIWRIWRRAHWLVYPFALVVLMHVLTVPTRTAGAQAILVTYVFVCVLLMSSAVALRVTFQVPTDGRGRKSRPPEVEVEA